MAKYQQYEEYKESEIEWIGDIPAHWEETPVFSCFNATSEKNLEGKENNVLSLSYGNIIKRNVDTNFGLLPESFNTYQIVDIGDIILRLTDLQNDKKSLRVGLAKEKGIITSAYLKLKPKENLDSGFAYRLLHSYDTTKVYYGLGGGLRQSMKFEDFRRLPILFPPYKEQTQIANFLDYETAQIDTLIEKQQTLIQLLKEKRQAVVSHAVTKGLNPDAPMKDSGVEWLGEVPAHWVVKKNKHLLELVTSGSRGWASYYSDEGKLFFRIANLTRDTIEPKLESIQNVMPPLGAEGERSKIQLDDLLISITADLGSVCVADNSIAGGFVSQHVSLCRPNSSVKSARWLAYFILSDSAKEQFVGSGYGGTKIQLSLEDIRELNIAYPPKKEQEDIASYIDIKLKKFELLMSEAEQAIQLMKERRTALISAAVTGKIDVRGWVAPE